MKRERWNQIDQLLDAALELPRQKRAAFLDQACAGDDELRKNLDALLASDDDARSFLEQPALDVAAKELVAKKASMLGQSIGHYRIVSQLGAGGMGEVYLAKDTKLDRKVALKILPSQLAADRSRMQRFVQEAKAASALNHPNILTIYEIGEVDGQRFIATEFIDGMTLRERLSSPLDVEDALDIAIQISSALAAAHKLHIIHRDIKPENIMIRREDQLAKVLDFGLAKMTQQRPSDVPADSAVATLLANTVPGVVLGTVAYMSPEQALGEKVDERSDIWSLGVVLYEMIAGCSPFVAGSSNEIISSILSKRPAPPLTRFATGVPERLQEIIDKALTKNKDERYQTSKDLLIDLKRLKQTLETDAAVKRSTSPDQVGAAAAREITTKAGVAATQSASSVEYIVSQVKSHKKAVIATAAMLISIGAIVTIVSFSPSRHRSATVGANAIGSIAVLPFVNANSDPDTDFIADGITDNIIERLSQLPNLKVMSHSAVFHYKDRPSDPRTIGTELTVEAVLTGRLVKRNDALSISLELVNARDNSHIWGEQYNRKLSELLALQREIPLDVSEKLRLTLSGESKERLTRANTDNPEAYQLYLKGRYAWENHTPDGVKQGVQYFEEAIKKDSNYALAYAGLADAYMFGFRREVALELSQKEAHRRGREAATKALSIDPQLGEAHAALGQVILLDEWDFSGAEREFKRAIELNPSHAEAHHQYSHLLLMLGRINESLIESKRYLELDPISFEPIAHLAYHYLYARQYDEAIRQYQKADALYPDLNPVIHLRLAEAFYQKGMFKEAVSEYLQWFAGTGSPPDKIAELRKAFAGSGIRGFYQKLIEQFKAKPQTEQTSVDIAGFYARLGEKDQAFAWLEKAFAQHADGLVRLKEELGFDNLRSDPRYAELLRRMGIPQ
jgi:serine/threonine-protein kinase